MRRNTYELFQLAERYEELSAELYRILAARFDDNPQARDLFSRLADEEVQHAARVRLLAAQYRNDSTLFAKAEGLASPPPDASALLRDLDAAVRDAAAGAPLGDFPAVLDCLMRFEDRGAAFHAQLLARGADPAISWFFDELARQDREHQRLLSSLKAA